LLGGGRDPIDCRSRGRRGMHPPEWCGAAPGQPTNRRECRRHDPRIYSRLARKPLFNRLCVLRVSAVPIFTTETRKTQRVCRGETPMSGNRQRRPLRVLILSAVKHPYIARAILAHHRFQAVAAADDAEQPDWVHERNERLAAQYG